MYLGMQNERKNGNIQMGRRKEKSNFRHNFYFFNCNYNSSPFSATSSGKIVYVATNGSGDFNCDGSEDQVEINQALAYVAENPQFTTVHLKGPNTYVISGSIFIGSNTILEGDPTAVIKLKDKAGWPDRKAYDYADG